MKLLLSGYTTLKSSLAPKEYKQKYSGFLEMMYFAFLKASFPDRIVAVF